MQKASSGTGGETKRRSQEQENTRMKKHREKLRKRAGTEMELSKEPRRCTARATFQKERGYPRYGSS
ncbi:hypothetical protein NDU88_002239 [Pleurodeles waltl]|uniref:Uncharacterized protein n=1 Tax=Pleurodeles waltl TaxID=8319 RepID=A0AAV7TMP4_PLEWA|nr:hypothetical protein NDU88_002239 [Pleurodeles waltl]